MWAPRAWTGFRGLPRWLQATSWVLVVLGALWLAPSAGGEGPTTGAIDDVEADDQGTASTSADEGDPADPDVPTTASPPDSTDTAGDTWTVVNIVDGDTLDVRAADRTEERVRVLGIDTPDRGECGYGEASIALADLVFREQVVLVAGGRDDRDRYDRLIRYVDADVDGTDAGYELLQLGLAIARYDSRDGYGAHPREDAYVAADAAAIDISCEGAPEPTAAPWPPASDPERSTPDPAASGNPWGTTSCDPAYDPCVPPVSEVGDLDCPDIRAVYPGGVRVDQSIGDPHGLDGDGDGGGCA